MRFVTRPDGNGGGSLVIGATQRGDMARLSPGVVYELGDPYNLKNCTVRPVGPAALDQHLWGRNVGDLVAARMGEMLLTDAELEGRSDHTEPYRALPATEPESCDDAFMAGAAAMLRAVLDTVDVEVKLGLGATQYLRDQLASIRVFRPGSLASVARADAHLRGPDVPPSVVDLLASVLERAGARASTAAQRLGMSDIQAGVVASLVVSTPLRKP